MTQTIINRLRDFRNEVNNLATLQKLMSDAADLLDKAYSSYVPKNIIEFESPLFADNGVVTHNLGGFKHRMEFNYHTDGDCGNIIWNYGKDAPDEDETVIGVWFWLDDDDNSWELVDYDGVFSLPEQAITLLEQCGIKVGEDFR